MGSDTCFSWQRFRQLKEIIKSSPGNHQWSATVCGTLERKLGTNSRNVAACMCVVYFWVSRELVHFDWRSKCKIYGRWSNKTRAFHQQLQDYSRPESRWWVVCCVCARHVLRILASKTTYEWWECTWWLVERRNYSLSRTKNVSVSAVPEFWFKQFSSSARLLADWKTIECQCVQSSAQHWRMQNGFAANKCAWSRWLAWHDHALASRIFYCSWWNFGSAWSGFNSIWSTLHAKSRWTFIPIGNWQVVQDSWVSVVRPWFWWLRVKEQSFLQQCWRLLNDVRRLGSTSEQSSDGCVPSAERSTCWYDASKNSKLEIGPREFVGDIRPSHTWHIISILCCTW